MMKNLKNVFVSFFAVMVVFVSPLSISNEETPEAVIEEAVTKLLTTFTEQKAALENDSVALFNLVDEIAGPNFDFGYISKLVLGKSYKSASEQQRQDFAYEFKRLLIVTYAKALFQYKGTEAMTFLETKIKEKKGSKFGTVNTEVTINEGKPKIFALQ